MVSLDSWVDPPPLGTPRLTLEPLRVEHADELAPVLDDRGLHTYTGGAPATRDELRQRYERQVVGRSPDGSQRWLNWAVRRREDGQVVGTMQATVSRTGDGVVAEVAWVIGTAHQRRGYAREAALEMVAWLRQQGTVAVIAHVHPRHRASIAVARALGLAPTDVVVDGEVRWATGPKVT